MRARGSAEELWGSWEVVLPFYAEAQVRLAEHASSLRASGVPVLSPATLPGVFRALVDDLHSGNVCWVTAPGHARIIDWGDASWGFPIATMLVTMNSLAWHAKCEVDDPRVLRARDAYLEPFTRYAGRRALLRYVELARRTGCVARSLSYRAALTGEPVATHRDYDFPVRAWLLEVLEG
jgi:hypothetical protein